MDGMVFVVFIQNMLYINNCSSDQWLLSAGHCFYEGEEVLDWVVVLGESDTLVIDGNELTLGVDKVNKSPSNK